MRRIDRFYDGNRSFKAAGLRHKKLLGQRSFLLGIRIKIEFGHPFFHLSVALGRKVPGNALTERSQQSPAHIAGKLLYRAQGGLAAGGELDKAAVLHAG